MAFNIEQAGAFQFSNKLISLTSTHFLIDSTVYSLSGSSFKLFLYLPSMPSSAILDDSLILAAIGNSLLLWDLKTHETCDQPTHKHLESQLLLWRGVSNPIALSLSNNLAIGYADDCFLGYNLDGSIIFNIANQREKPIESIISKNKLVALLNDQSILIIDISTQVEILWENFLTISIGKGDFLLFGCADGKIRNYDNGINEKINLYEIMDHEENELTIVSLYSFKDFIFVGFPLSIAVFCNEEIILSFPLENFACHINFIETHCLIAHPLKSLATLYTLSESEEDNYSSDFEEESPSPVYEENEKTEEEALSLETPQQDITVVMNFEPTSRILNTSNPKLPNKSKKQKIQDKPVTFHKKIKSSGYGIKQKPIKKTKNLLSKKYIYPTHLPPPSNLQEENLFPKDAPLHNGPIFNIQYSQDATKLATCGNDAAFIVKLPISKYKGERIPLVGHEGPVTSVNWNSDCKYILTSSLDNTIKLWGTSSNKPGECLLSILGDFFDVKFYFVDKFIAASQGSHISLYRYKLRDPHYKDDIKRLQAKCSYKEVHNMVHPSAQNISKFACHNSFYSHLMLFAGSNKIISVWDVDKDMEILSIPTIHRKPINTIRFYNGSDYIEPNYDFFNIFLTGACDNYLNLYDIRTPNESIGCFVGHLNTGLNLGACVSPCMRYVASGSEDKSAYIWDIRTMRVLQRLRGFRENTNDIAWNPMHPQICVADNEGHIKFFKP
ncbi:unnamed protein product [Blepharisma stoltei]|uniref:WD repeat-containing protein n=1 Tax=Blepharisma stoltei TaxID=1481888 RepID=A0AAU9J4P9_9CILI|nr:unnamed protein product [Blepharisma stoltei]